MFQDLLMLIPHNINCSNNIYFFFLFFSVLCVLDARTCSMANCQYGCEVMKGEVRCQCPSPGLQLAPDGRTCVGTPARCEPNKLCFFTVNSEAHCLTKKHNMERLCLLLPAALGIPLALICSLLIKRRSLLLPFLMLTVKQ